MHLLNFLINLFYNFYTEKSLEKTFYKEKTRATRSDEWEYLVNNIFSELDKDLSSRFIYEL